MDKTNVILGPFDVALEEPVYFKIEPNSDGKTIHSVDMINGFVHRGIESIVLQRNFLQNLIITEKVCALCSNNHPFTYCMAVEKIAGLSLPERALYLRVVADEIKRIASHLFNLGMLSHLIHNKTLMTQFLETREDFQDLKEAIWGNRMDLSANTIGGVKFDLDEKLIASIKATLDKNRSKIEAFIALFETDPTLIARIGGVGVLSYEDALRLGVVGPVARASGVNNDVRKRAPYAAYANLHFDVVLQQDGDVLSRAKVRLYEILESMKLLHQALDSMPTGDIVLPTRTLIPEGEAVSRTEAPRGELVYYLKTNGTQKPERMKWRVPTYMNWEALKVMMPNNNIDDVALIFNSIDPCISCTER
ncbi:hydrogenase large subunit [Sulfurospirillum diekertiae]|uniref:ECH-like hydrogenase large subunit CooH-like n=1 Tax=Sulfurospirillum diekertiae TaxID=1854492 RepID=A0A1Y0HKP5_9BACT|nr:nickel-dependent hydrogenase large subunit [Sulfurospirillum diekertiae]ARU48530.1 ECH-like hydrogenase large subunit CooH-like [Sulfurospirillum diekertiae]ASC93362.1 ECH-like hydrogenase large subunit CooH-like [Sulfurospirillum diekertiae]